MRNKFVLLFAFCTGSIAVHAAVTLPKIFADNMVLQRNVLIPVWGWADANEKVTVKFNGQTKTVKADKSGKWMVRLDAETAGGPYELLIQGKNIVEIKNVLVGEVWLCSGQSNMEFPVGKSKGWGLSNYEEVTAAAVNYPMIRQIKVSHTISSLPETNITTTGWQICNPSTVGDFTAIGYIFAKRIYDSLKIPIGIINDSWGGTNIETWISREGFESSDEYAAMIAGMPKISFDSLSKLKVGANLQRVETIQHKKLSDVNSITFKDAICDDSNWPEIYGPMVWENQILGDFNGVVWLRKTFLLTATDITNAAILELAKIDDDDITYINGVKVGSTNYWEAKRKYPVPIGILKEGVNTIAVKITDDRGNGGIYGDTADMKLTLPGKIIPLSGKWKFQVASIKADLSENSLPSLCYNSMMAPLIPYAFKGALWYQGEGNEFRAYQYRKAFPLLITDWRKKFNNPNMPFYFVQLATYNRAGNSNEGCAWAELREAQALTLALPNTGMCVTTDIGNPWDIHPANKQDIGKRLSAIALNNLYAKPMICSGPSYKSMEIKGNQIILSFNDIGTGLFTPDKYGYIKGFEIAGADSVFYFARAYINDNKIILSSPNVLAPLAAHFGWIGNASDCNLFNKEGFPAVPFRTDEWKTVTKDEKYTIEKF